MNEIKLKAYAKINLCLYITGVRKDGYHLLDSVFVPISIYDEITIRKNTSGININCEADIPIDERNTAYKAAKLIMEDADIDGVDIEIKKNIPTMAGLGGGSADAVAVLKGMNILFDLNIEDKKLSEMGLCIGADVPFFLGKGAARVQGIGEILTSIKIKEDLNLVIVKPQKALSTIDVYKKYDEMAYKTNGNSIELIQALGKGDLYGICQRLKNDLEQAAIELCPEVKSSINLLKKNGAVDALMTGSGSCVFGIFESKSMAEKAVKKLSAETKAHLAHSISCPVEVVW